MANKRVKYAPFGRPTSKSEALLLAAYARRYVAVASADALWQH